MFSMQRWIVQQRLISEASAPSTDQRGMCFFSAGGAERRLANDLSTQARDANRQSKNVEKQLIAAPAAVAAAAGSQMSLQNHCQLSLPCHCHVIVLYSEVAKLQGQLKVFRCSAPSAARSALASCGSLVNGCGCRPSRNTSIASNCALPMASGLPEPTWRMH